MRNPSGPGRQHAPAKRPDICAQPIDLPLSFGLAGRGRTIYIECGIDIRIPHVSTGYAFESLFPAILFCHMSAPMATLAGIGRINRLHPVCLVLQHPAQPTPAAFRNSPVQDRLCLDILPGPLHRALGRFRHPLDVQIFQADRPEALCQVMTELVPPIVPDIGDPSKQLRHSPPLFLATTRIHPDYLALLGLPRHPVCIQQRYPLAAVHLPLVPL